jgi:hypothetical protein
VTSDELLDTVLALGVQVLELMHGRELLHVQPVRGDYVCGVVGEKEREGARERTGKGERTKERRGRDNRREER